MLSIFKGRASCDLLELVLSGIEKDLEDIRSGACPARQVLLIVPAQFTLEAEEAAFRHFDAEGFFDFQIVSGNKLLQDIMRKTGGPGVTSINTLGRTMLLRKIASDNRDKLEVFGKVCENTRFLKMAGDFIVQMKQNQLEEEDLKAMETLCGEDSLLGRKLRDMALFSREYAAAMEGRFTDSEDRLKFVTGKVPQCDFIKESIIWYYGFYSFTPREADFMKALMENAAALKVAITMGKEGDPDEDLFRAPAGAVRRLLSKAEECGSEAKVYYAEKSYSRNLKPELGHLERNLYALPPNAMAGDPKVIRLTCCGNPYSQAESLLLEIMRLVREEGYSYDRIAILTEDMPGQGEVIKRTASEFGVPLFADEKRAVSHMPAVETAAALLQLAAGGGHARDMLSFLKAGFADIPSMEKKEDLEDYENYVKQYHIQKDRFFKPFKYGKESLGEGFMRMEAIRSETAEILSPFFKGMEEAKSVRGKTECLYRFLKEVLKMPEKLEARAAELAEKLLLDAAEEQQQIWDVIVGLMDQCNELLGSFEMSTEEYAKLLTESFGDIKVGLLPQAQGKVLLGTLSRSLPSGCRALFIAGVNDGILPQDSEAEAILTQRELEYLKEKDYTLSKTGEVLRMEKDMTIYKAFTAPSDFLWVSYCRSDVSGQELKPSVLINRIKSAFPDITEQEDCRSAGALLPFVQGQQAASGRLGAAMRQAVSDGRAQGALEKFIFNELEDKTAIKAGLLYNNLKPQTIGPEKTEALYAHKGEYSLSPSRLERFTRCPFSFFVNYGLRAADPQEFTISPIELGNLHHDCILKLSQWLSQPSMEGGFAITDPKSRWSSVSWEEIRQKTGEIVALLLEEERFDVMHAGPQQEYQTSRIEEVCAKFAWQMVLSVRKGSIAEMYFETEFGKGKSFPAIEIPTAYGMVRLEGKIDRVDMLSCGADKYAKVIDYKSGINKFSRPMAEKGLMLQLGIYLEGALGRGDAKPAGVFYYHIEEPELASDSENLLSEQISEDLWTNISKKYKMDGFYVNDMAVLKSMDRDLESGSSSGVFNCRISSGGEVLGGTDAEDFENFRAKFREALAGAAGEFASGKTDIAPKRIGGKTSCDYCPFGGICGESLLK